ncbi:MAG: hypothetical protein KGZ97_09160 [Bacteroidetes bacterium]|nr:hypothetical protein [Bacteroidota bacterium]
MKKSLIIAIASILMLMISCNNSTQNTDAPYAGERIFKGPIKITYLDSVRYNDTISIITSLPVQNYRMKGYLSFYIGGGSGTTFKLLSPYSFKGRHPNDKYDKYWRGIRIEIYPNQSISQEWLYIIDSSEVDKYRINDVIQFQAFLEIDSIYLDMDSLYFPGSLGDELQPVSVPEKKWYDCDFSKYQSEQIHMEHKILLRYFSSQNFTSTLVEYFYFKSN